MSYGRMASSWVDDVAKSKNGEHLLGGAPFSFKLE
jgi:hypothetical protein